MPVDKFAGLLPSRAGPPACRSGKLDGGVDGGGVFAVYTRGQGAVDSCGVSERLHDSGFSGKEGQWQGRRKEQLGSVSSHGAVVEAAGIEARFLGHRRSRHWHCSVE